VSFAGVTLCPDETGGSFTGVIVKLAVAVVELSDPSWVVNEILSVAK
jgi:hypothetical protein